MAQAVFDEHPLEQYLRDAGEGVDVMPGSTAELTQELESFLTNSDDADSNIEPDWDWRPQFLVYLLHYLETLISTAHLTNPTNPLVERFKYNVISSSLLSPELTPPHTHTSTQLSSSRHRSIPGNLPHSRTSSELSQHPVVPTSCAPDPAACAEAQCGLLSGLIVVVAVLLSIGFTTLAILTLWAGLAGIYYLWVQSHSMRQIDLTPCLETLDELISINNDWESIVQEVITTLEKDERNALGSSSSSSHTSPSSSLRVALHSTLQTTQTQCDNVRHLLSALTSPSDLSQLSEMYAPPSPVKPNFSPHDARRPVSYPLDKRRERPTSPTPSPTTVFTDNKRMTWNGPHSHSEGKFAISTPLTAPLMKKRRLRHRSDLSSILGNSPVSASAVSFSVPVTPSPSSPLARVSEDVPEADLPLPDDSFDQGRDEGEEVEEEEEGNTSFAAAALKMQRSRANNGLEALALSPTSTPSRQAQSTCGCTPPLRPGAGLGLGMRSTFQHSSRFTSVHTSRQPLSLSALRHALQAALGAKRYACAHLLALRFSDEDTTTTLTAMATSGGGEGVESSYWEDVKSIMELLIGALSDACARLCEAVREVEALRLRDQTPTPCGSVDGSANGNGSLLGGSPRMRKFVIEKEKERRRLSEVINPEMVGMNAAAAANTVSFAPMPSHMSRFAGHVAAMRSALDDARVYLDGCVGALKGSDDSSSSQSRAQVEDENDHPALKVYEKLRRELGFALRECERGRSRLLDIIKPPPPPPVLDLEAEDSEEGVPGLGHDSASDESDKASAEVVSPSQSDDGNGKKDNVNVVDAGDSVLDGIMDHDDASRELLLGADVDHLPPAHVGIEQVFEADTSSAASGPVREKTKLSREERIKLVKARRESLTKAGGLGLGVEMAVGVGLGVGLEPSPVLHGDSESGGGYDEKWGPGGDVVQELKDVIWKVGERRRKVQQQQQPSQQKDVQQQQQSNQQKDAQQQQPHDEQQKLEPPPALMRETSLPSSLDSTSPRPKSVSRLPSPVVSPRPRPPAGMNGKQRVSSPLARSPRSSMGKESFPPSLIPRRMSVVSPVALGSVSERMDMQSLLASLQKELDVRKDGEEVVLSSE